MGNPPHTHTHTTISFKNLTLLWGLVLPWPRRYGSTGRNDPDGVEWATLQVPFPASAFLRTSCCFLSPRHSFIYSNASLNPHLGSGTVPGCRAVAVTKASLVPRLHSGDTDEKQAIPR